MSKTASGNTPIKKALVRLGVKSRDSMLILVLGLVLIFVAWKIFHTEEESVVTNSVMTEAEVKVMRLLEEIDGVGEAEVIVYEENDEVKNVVVVCDGARDLRVIMNIREAVAAVLGTEEKSIRVYLKKE